MRVTRKNADMRDFGKLHAGDVFVDFGEIYIKLADNVTYGGTATINAINLENGSLASYTASAPVELVTAELVIE